jgi:hypothetical protein
MSDWPFEKLAGTSGGALKSLDGDRTSNSSFEDSVYPRDTLKSIDDENFSVPFKPTLRLNSLYV